MPPTPHKMTVTMGHTREKELYNLLSTIHLIGADCDRQVFRRFGLTVKRFWMLHHISVEPGISLTMLSDRTFTDKASISRMIHSMEQEGLIRRELDPDDRRAYCLYCTQEGSAQHEEAWSALQDDLRERIDWLTPVKYGQLVACLEELKENLQAHLALWSEADSVD